MNRTYDMKNFSLKFSFLERKLAVTLHNDDGLWKVRRYVGDDWRAVCESAEFDYARHAFDSEILKIENEIKYEAAGS